MVGVDAAIANALRRILLAEVRAYQINFYHPLQEFLRVLHMCDFLLICHQ